MLAQIYDTLRKRRGWVIAGLLLGILTGLRIGLHQPQIFVATARVIIQRSDTGGLRLNSSVARRSGKVSLANEFIKMREEVVLNQVIRELNLMNDPAFAAERKRHPDDAALRRRLLAELRSGLFVAAEPQTNIVDVSFTSGDPDYSAAVVNKLVQVFAQRLVQERVDQIARASQWPSTQLAVLRQEVVTTRDKMIGVQRELGNTGFNAEAYRTENTLDPLTRNAVTARLASAGAQQQYQSFRALPAAQQQAELEALPETGSRSLRDSMAQLNSLRPVQAALAAQLGPNHPQFRANQAELETLENQLAEARDQRLNTLRLRMVQAQAAQADAENLLEAETARVYSLGSASVRYRALLRQFTFISQLYGQLFTRIRTAGLQAGFSALSVEVLDPAVPPLAPVIEPVWLIVLNDALVGLFAGSIVALAIQNFRPGLTNLHEVEAITDLPALATLPRLGLGDADQLATMSVAMQNLPVIGDPHSRFADGIGNLLLNLQLSSPGAEPQVILFTSATPSEGKTTVAANFAVSMARTSGRHVLLIDADLHRPNLHHRFGLPGRFGLSSILAGALTLDQTLQSIPEVPTLDILPAGPVPPSPYELLSAPAMLSLLRQAVTRYDCIVIDAPPVLAVADSVLLSRFVDAVVYVVRQGKVGRNVIRRGRDLLATADAPLAGVVLNALQATDDDTLPV